MSYTLILLTGRYGWDSMADIGLYPSTMGSMFGVWMETTLGARNGPYAIGSRLFGSSAVVGCVMCLDSLKWALLVRFDGRCWYQSFIDGSNIWGVDRTTPLGPKMNNPLLSRSYLVVLPSYDLSSKFTLIQPTWSAYSYDLVFLIWYPYSLLWYFYGYSFIVCIPRCTSCTRDNKGIWIWIWIWYPYAPTSLYGNTAHCSGCGVAMGCYGLSIVPRTAIVTSQWYYRYCFAGYARTWARHPTTPWQRECTAITEARSVDVGNLDI